MQSAMLKLEGSSNKSYKQRKTDGFGAIYEWYLILYVF